VDNSNDELSITASGNSKIQVWIAGLTATLTISDTSWVGSETITFTVYDLDNASDSAEAEFKVTTTTSVDGNSNTVPEHFALNANYPNPFNPQTTIPFELQQAGSVTLDIYSVDGRHIVAHLDIHNATDRHTPESLGEVNTGKVIDTGLERGIHTRQLVGKLSIDNGFTANFAFAEGGYPHELGTVAPGDIEAEVFEQTGIADRKLDRILRTVDAGQKVIRTTRAVDVHVTSANPVAIAEIIRQPDTAAIDDDIAGFVGVEAINLAGSRIYDARTLETIDVGRAVVVDIDEQALVDQRLIADLKGLLIFRAGINIAIAGRTAGTIHIVLGTTEKNDRPEVQVDILRFDDRIVKSGLIGDAEIVIFSRRENGSNSG